jgi:predicted secreted protein with PEFG-CTERM motif
MITLLLISVSFSNFVFASSYDINMPTGSASPDAPYFWQNEKSGLATGDIDIFIGDTVIWKNADTTIHTVTSGTPNDGPDGIFGNSDFINPGQSYQFTFDKKGQYPYYCLIHPWMTGTVLVTDGYQTIPDVGQTIGDGKSVFDVEYRFNRALSLNTITEGQKSITFEILGNAQSDDNTLKLRLPAGLIDGPFVIIVDGEKLTDYEHFKDNDLNTISISIPDDSKLLTIIGTSIVPEFGSLSIVILAIAIVSIMITGQKSRFRLNL